MVSWWPPVGGFHMRTTSGATPGLPKHTGPLNDSRCNSSSAEAGFQKVYHHATSELLPKGIHTITGEGNSTLHPTSISPGKQVYAYLPGGHSSTYLWWRPVR
ncbi:hypothetical protein AVEN_186475-1 [Araneus ventricosus]|uniref:Uncharacterized protein n=1 Tax=Araneus ventricosus TaxID=182803 RepID=A0A4Y2USD9_ARAVE|nr:hypothetical protein AVEN_13610-1 [Araneus ventricosus]GBO15017.1 hypothetical protein AVEN_186475-1 [Araneus ventricosus]